MNHHFIKHSRFISAAVGIAVAASLIAGPALAQAASLTQAQISAITNLLSSFGADSSVIANVQSVLEDSSASTSSVVQPSSSCATLSGDIGEGDQGQNVSDLQDFLKQDSSIYPEGVVTGYFGHLTEEAIQRFQEKHDIVATGTPDTTGFGIVGPRTREEIDLEMEQNCQDQQNRENDSMASSTMSHESESEASSTTATSTGDNNSGD